MCLLCSILFGESCAPRRALSYGGCGAASDAPAACGGCGAAAEREAPCGGSPYGRSPCGAWAGCGARDSGSSFGCGTYAEARAGGGSCMSACACRDCSGFGRHGDGGVCCDEAYYCRQYALCCCEKKCGCENCCCEKKYFRERKCICGG